MAVDLDKIDSLEQLLDQIPNLRFFEKLFGKKYLIYEKAVSICIHDESCTEFGKLKLLQAALRLPEDAIKNREEGVWRSYCEEEIKKGSVLDSVVFTKQDHQEILEMLTVQIPDRAEARRLAVRSAAPRLDLDSVATCIDCVVTLCRRCGWSQTKRCAGQRL